MYQPALQLRSFERDRDGTPLINAMLPPGGKDDGRYSIRVVGPGGADTDLGEVDAVQALEKHFGLSIHVPPEGAYTLAWSP